MASVQPQSSLFKLAPATVVAISAAVAFLLYGFDTGIIAGALLYIVPEYHLEQHLWLQGAIVSAVVIGALPGIMLSGHGCDIFGRRQFILLSSLLFVVGGLAMALAARVWMLILGRLIVGLAVGAAAPAVPVFIAECTPPDMRGQLATLPQLGMSCGILLSYATALAFSLEPSPQWRLMLGASIIPALVLLGLITRVPESPRWLALKGRHADAATSATRLRLPDSEDYGEVGDSRTRLLPGGRVDEEEVPAGFQGLWQHVVDSLNDLSTPGTQRALLVGAGLQSFQQLVGINAIVFYTPRILLAAGSKDLLPINDKSAAILATIFSYSLKVPSVLLSMSLVDRLGRRLLLLYSIPFMIVSLGVLAAAFQFQAMGAARALVAVICIAIYGSSFVLALGPTPNILCSEMFETRVRGLGMGICVFVNFFFSVAVCQTFPTLAESLGMPFVLLLFAAFSAGAWLFVLLLLPETACIPLELTPRLLLKAWRKQHVLNDKR